MAWILDSCIAIDLRDSRGDIVSRVTALPVRPVISAITKVELEGGVYADPVQSDRRRRALDAVLANLEIIDFDSEMADAYGVIVAKHGFNRRKVIDRMIASTAIVQGLTLITSNETDFAEIEGLDLLVWKQ